VTDFRIIGRTPRGELLVCSGIKRWGGGDAINLSSNTCRSVYKPCALLKFLWKFFRRAHPFVKKRLNETKRL
jgi:hypothetical protein